MAAHTFKPLMLGDETAPILLCRVCDEFYDHPDHSPAAIREAQLERVLQAAVQS